MINKIKALINENRKNQLKIIELNQELNWANAYHDSIRGKIYVENLSLNIGRWAGNYAFFYVLNRILNDFRPNTILELGLGESSKLISTYLDNDLINSKHLIIEQDEHWKIFFLERFKISKHTEIKVCPMGKTIVKGFETNSYTNLSKVVTQQFDLYIVDGPYGSSNYSRYDILKLVKDFKTKDQFIIIIDDYNRQGEKEMVLDLLSFFQMRNIKIYSNSYTGNKSIFVIATEKYKYAISL